MSSFFHWSGWFRSVFVDDKADADLLAVMGWIMAHASEDGAGWAFDVDTSVWLGREVGIGPERARRAIKSLKEAGLIIETSGGTPDVVTMQVVFPGGVTAP